MIEFAPHHVFSQDFQDQVTPDHENKQNHPMPQQIPMKTGNQIQLQEKNHAGCVRSLTYEVAHIYPVLRLYINQPDHRTPQCLNNSHGRKEMLGSQCFLFLHHQSMQLSNKYGNPFISKNKGGRRLAELPVT